MKYHEMIAHEVYQMVIEKENIESRVDLWFLGDLFIRTVFQKLIRNPKIIEIKIIHIRAILIENDCKKAEARSIPIVITRRIDLVESTFCSFLIIFAHIAENIHVIAKTIPMFFIFTQSCWRYGW